MYGVPAGARSSSGRTSRVKPAAVNAARVRERHWASRAVGADARSSRTLAASSKSGSGAAATRVSSRSSSVN
jgi:hypothetical protein